MKDILNLSIKNFKLAFRTKTAIFTLLLAPIVIILLLAFAFNNTAVYNINIGIYAEQYTPLADTLIENLNEQSFKLVRVNTEQFCIDQVKEGIISLCMVFPPDLEIGEGKSNEIVFHVDPSKVNLVSQVVDIISAKLAPASDEISINLTTNLLDRIQNTNSELESKKLVIESLKGNIKDLSYHNSEIDRAITKTIDLSDFKISDVSDSTGAVQEKIDSLINFMKGKVNSLRSISDDIGDAQDMVDSEQSSLDSKLSDIIESLDDDIDAIENKMNSTKVDTASEFASMNTLVDDMEGKFNHIVDILNMINREKDASKILLENASANVNDLSSSFDKMSSALSGIDITSAESIVNPFTTTIRPVVVNRSHLNLVYAGIVMLIVMFVSILLSSTMVMMERKSKSYLINYMAPTKDISFVISQYITIMTLLILQTIIILGISAFFFTSQITGNIPQLAVIFFISLTFFVLLGMLIAYFFQAEQTITLMSIAIGSLFLLLSNIILPIEVMPRAFQNIVNYNPFLIAENLLKKVIQFDAPFSHLSHDIILLAVYSAVAFFLILMVEGLLKRKGLIKMFRALFRKK